MRPRIECPDSNTTGIRPHLLPLLLLIALTAIAYSRILGHDFLTDWDDQKYVVQNEAIRGFTPAHIRTAFTSFYMGNYAPFQIVSYMLDYSFWGMKAAGFFLTNIILHVANGILYYFLMVRCSVTRWTASLAVFIFLLHPVQVESVAWVSQRKNLLAMFFFLVAFHLYVKYRERGQRGRYRWYAGSLAAFVIAVLSKSVAVILPLVLLCYDACYFERFSSRKAFKDMFPYMAVAILIVLITLKSQMPGFEGGRTGFHGGSPLATFLTMLPTFVRYLGLLFYPTGLSVIYDPPIKTVMDGEVLFAMLIALILSAFGYILLRRDKRLFFWISVSILGLLPVAQIIPFSSLMNDRYLYFPMLGVALLVAQGCGAAVKRTAGKQQKLATAGICLVLASLPVLSFSRAAVWRDSLTLWTDANAKFPNNPNPLFALGETHHQAGRMEMARTYYLRALAIDTFDKRTLHNISNLFLEINEPEKAKPYMQRLVSAYPQYGEGYLLLGHYYSLAGDLPAAESAIKTALRLEPRSGLAMSYLGNVCLARHDYISAGSYYNQALSTGWDSAEIRYNFASLEAANGHEEEALRNLEAAFRLGFRDFDGIIENRNFSILHERKEFKALLAGYGFHNRNLIHVPK